jgi:crotonobetainyl-CoA:carnitine CoA-transferase CaiB-like acyl-CoA transferase
VSEASPAPLDGIVVVDFSRLIAGPCATDLLASMGARVIKVEGAEGDPMRLTRSKTAGGGPTAPTFAAFNVLKETIALDLKDPSDLRLALELCRDADVVVEAFRPGVMDRLGLGAERLRAENPRLIYAALSAFGDKGPDSERGGVDIVLQAETGLMSVTGDADQDPMKVGVPVLDAASASMLAVGILAALVGREKTGRGDVVRTSMLAVGIHLQAQQYAEFLSSGVVPPRVGNRAAYAAPADVFEASDGRIVLSAHIQPHWRALCGILGHPEWVADPRFEVVEKRVQNREALNALITKALAAATVDEWLALLDAAGITAGKVRDYRAVIDSAQVAEDGAVVDAVNVDGSPIRVVRTPLRFDSFDDRRFARRVRGIDADGDAIRAGMLERVE